MHKKSSIGKTFLALTLTAVVLSFFAVLDLFEQLGNQNTFDGAHKTDAITRVFRNIDSASAKKTVPRRPTFSGTSKSPFRVFAAVKQESATRTGESRPTCAVILKAILAKSNPLAIIQEETGMNVIYTVGDTVCGMRLEKIDAESVLLSRGSQRLVLTIPEIGQ